MAAAATVKTAIGFSGNLDWLTGHWGHGAIPVPVVFGPGVPENERIGVSLDDDFHIVIEGHGQKLVDIEFRSLGDCESSSFFAVRSTDSSHDSRAFHNRDGEYFDQDLTRVDPDS